MRLARLEISGFRGVAGQLTLNIPPGFAVIVGPNGSGKSTICDAIEFALSGTIRASSAHKEKGESILDYLWWRGPARDQDAFVELHVMDDEGHTSRIRRTATEVQVSPPQDLATLLCTATDILHEPLTQLTRTTIIRDEEITELSVDLRETDRFDFVRTVLGSADFGAAESKAKRVAELLKQQRDEMQRGYEIARDRATQLSTRFSQAMVHASRATGVAESEEVLRSLLPSPPRDGKSLFVAGEQELAKIRLNIDNLIRVYTRVESVLKRLTEIRTSEYAVRISELENQIQKTQGELDHISEEAKAIVAQLSAAQEAAPRATSLATLHEQGSRLGLQDGHCPLCGAGRDKDSFDRHLEKIHAEAESLNSSAARLSQQHAVANQQVLSLTKQLMGSKDEHARLSSAAAVLSSELDALRAEAIKLGSAIGERDVPQLDRLSEEISARRATATRVEKALAVLGASRAVEQASELERQVAVAKEELANAERRVAHLTEAQGRVREAVSSIRRLQGEIIDQRLAELSPLLVELYERLRPHLDWQDVRYRLRGDVRRMLSFEVGDSLNPSFLFSSGQRRAAGLAFILALHLSRRWCKLKTLVLDDPVQHVDDYRALHLAEVLAAIRRQDHQVLCTVEDAALGELLARRLRSSVESTGTVITMKYSPGRGVFKEDERTVQPFNPRVLLSA